MAALSKVQFEELFTNAACSTLVHPWAENCVQAQLLVMRRCFLGSLQHMIIFYSIKTLFKYRKVNRKYFEDNSWCFLRATIAGTSVASNFILLSCAIRKLLGKYHYLSAVSLPGALTALGVFIARESKRNVISHAVFQMALQVLLEQLNGGKSHRHLLLDTISFMLANSYLLYLIRKETVKEPSQRVPTFWIYTPPPTKLSEGTDRTTPCPHNEPCLDYIKQGASIYFQFGCAVQLVNTLVGKYALLRKSPGSAFKILFRPSNLRMGLFAGAYAGLYRAVTCFLCRKYQKDQTEYALIGGFISGISFLLCPLTSFTTTALATILLARIREFEKYIKLPIFGELLFCISIGFLTHLQFFHPHLLGKSASSIIGSVTGGWTKETIANFDKLIKSNKVKIS